MQGMRINQMDGNAIASSSKLPSAVQGSIAPSKLVQPPTAKKSGATTAIVRPSATSTARPGGAKTAAIAAASLSQASDAIAEKKAVLASKVSKAANLVKSQHHAEVMKLAGKDSLAASGSLQSPLPRLVYLLRLRKDEENPNWDGKERPLVELTVGETFSFVQNMKLAPQRFIKEFARNGEAVKIAMYMFERCMVGMKQDGDDDEAWAKTCAQLLIVSSLAKGWKSVWCGAYRVEVLILTIVSGFPLMYLLRTVHERLRTTHAGGCSSLGTDGRDDQKFEGQESLGSSWSESTG